MFEKFEKIGEEIYIYKNFLSEEECKAITERLDSLDESEWILDDPRDNNRLRTNPLKEIISVREKLNALVPDELYLGPANTATRLVKGSFWPEHSDVHDFLEIEKQAALYEEGMPYEQKDLSLYGTVVYFNEFEGGEVYYPTQNIVHAPQPGDLVIHSSGPICFHGVKPVISEKRYSYSNHIYTKIRVPA